MPRSYEPEATPEEYDRPEPLHVDPPHLDYYDQDSWRTRLVRWIFGARRQPHQETKGLSPELQRLVTQGQVIVDDLAGWQRELLDRIRESYGENDPVPESLLSVPRQHGGMVGTMSDPYQPSAGADGPEEQGRPDPVGPAERASSDTRSERLTTHKATEGEGLIKALCASGGYQLAESWDLVDCEDCLASEDDLSSGSASDARPKIHHSPDSLAPRRAQLRYTCGLLPSPMGEGPDYGSMDWSRITCARCLEVGRGLGDLAAPGRPSDVAAEALGALARLTGGERAEEHARTVADVTHWLERPSEGGMSPWKPVCGAGPTDWFRGVRVRASLQKVTCQECLQVIGKRIMSGDFSLITIEPEPAVTEPPAEPEPEPGSSSEDPQPVRDSVFDVLAEEWRLFKDHRPAGAYLPVGQLDGDCATCHVPWPCPDVQPILVQWAGSYAGGMIAKARMAPEDLVAPEDRQGIGRLAVEYPAQERRVIPEDVTPSHVESEGAPWKLKVDEDESVAPGVVEFRDEDGRTVDRITGLDGEDHFDHHPESWLLSENMWHLPGPPPGMACGFEIPYPESLVKYRRPVSVQAVMCPVCLAIAEGRKPLVLDWGRRRELMGPRSLELLERQRDQRERGVHRPSYSWRNWTPPSLLDVIEEQYVAFRLGHAATGTRETPEGFGRLFRQWIKPHIEGNLGCHGNALYWCPRANQIECPDHGGFDTCCASPERHISIRDIERYLQLDKGDALENWMYHQRTAKQAGPTYPTWSGCRYCDREDPHVHAPRRKDAVLRDVEHAAEVVGVGYIEVTYDPCDHKRQSCEDIGCEGPYVYRYLDPAKVTINLGKS